MKKGFINDYDHERCRTTGAKWVEQESDNQWEKWSWNNHSSKFISLVFWAM